MMRFEVDNSIGNNGQNNRWNESYINCGYEIKWSYDRHIDESKLNNCVEKPDKFRTLTNWAIKPQMVRAGHL